MNKKEYKLLVENWRCLVNEAMAPDADLIPLDWSRFVENVDNFANKTKSYNPDSDATRNMRDKIYGSLWNVFWESFQSSEESKNIHHDTTSAEECIERFFRVLARVYNSPENKSKFDKAFRYLSSSEVHGDGSAKFVSLPIGMIWDKYMYNMRGRCEGYCWDTHEEAMEIFKAFKVEYQKLILAGFDLESGECKYLSAK